MYVSFAPEDAETRQVTCSLFVTGLYVCVCVQVKCNINEKMSSYRAMSLTLQCMIGMRLRQGGSAAPGSKSVICVRGRFPWRQRTLSHARERAHHVGGCCSGRGRMGFSYLPM